MKLYTSIGPNPRVVDMFLHEKGAADVVERIELDLIGGENRGAKYLAINPMGQSPALVLDDGQVITEVTVICEYIEEMQPQPPVVGATAKERADTRRWLRWVDLNICEPLANGFRFAEGLQMFESRMRCLPEAADGLKACAQDKLRWLDEHLEQRQYLCGDRFTLADIHLYSFLDFGTKVGQPLAAENERVLAWHQRVTARPSAQATGAP